MYDTTLVDVLDSLENRPAEVRHIPTHPSRTVGICARATNEMQADAHLVVVSLDAYPVKQLASRTKIENEVEVVGRLRIRLLCAVHSTMKSGHTSK